MDRLRARKAFRYNSRQLQVGDVFDAKKPLDARLLLASKRAEVAPVAPALKKPEQQEQPDERVALRTEYERVIGRPPFMGWTAETLRDKIAAAKKAEDDQS